MKKFKPTKFDVMVLGLTALFLLVTGLYFVVCNGAFCPLCQDYFISNGETYIWDTRGGYLEPLSTLVFSALCLQERLTPIQAVGAALILGGAAFGELYKGRQKQMEE